MSTIALIFPSIFRDFSQLVCSDCLCFGDDVCVVCTLRTFSYLS